MPTPNQASQPVRWGAAIAWAAFLASSWCWCIGMWLPLYMARDFGWPAWLVFLIPNAVGAAMVGVGLARMGPGASERIESRHAGAMRWFSMVTIAFHAYFLAMQLTIAVRFMNQNLAVALGPIVALLCVACATGLAGLGSRAWRGIGLVVLGVSAGCAAAIALIGPRGALSIPPAEGTFGPGALAMFAPAVLLGFLTCPWLDLTFHRARREAPGRTGTAAFLIAFGVLFPALMVFTLLYAGGALKNIASLWMYAHLAVQSSFTIGAHARELGERGGLWPRREQHALDEAARWRTGARDLGLTCGVIVLAAGIAAWALQLGELRTGYRVTRLGYDLILSCYAMVFPAYIWVVMLGRRGSPRARRIVFVLVCVLAAPAFFMGSVLQNHVWLLVGVGLVLIVPLALGRLVPAGGAAPGHTPAV